MTADTEGTRVCVGVKGVQSTPTIYKTISGIIKVIRTIVTEVDQADKWGRGRGRFGEDGK